MTALRAATGATVNQLRNDGRLPANVLVLTYNNSLRGYVSAVAREELTDYAQDIRLYIMTFDKWAYETLNWQGALPLDAINSHILRLASPFPRDTLFVIDEVSYVLGRFPATSLGDDATAPRTGRGRLHRWIVQCGKSCLDEVIYPLLKWKSEHGYSDFHDLALSMAEAQPDARYDVIVVDEAQDLSANQLRAILKHAAPDATITIITDSAQRIYPRGAPWTKLAFRSPLTAALSSHVIIGTLVR